MTTTIDQLFDISDFVTEEEREWQLKAYLLYTSRCV